MTPPGGASGAQISRSKGMTPAIIGAQAEGQAERVIGLLVVQIALAAGREPSRHLTGRHA
jgi:hypothetical protein